MPVRWRSRCSICARYCLLLRLRSRSWSSSASTPVAITPPSLKEMGGSATIVFSMRVRRSLSSSMAACRLCSLSPEKRPTAPRAAGIRPRDAANASTSRGFAVSRVTRLSSRSRSRMPSNARRNSSRATVSFTWASTASRRASISIRSMEGRSIQARSRRLPMGVTVASTARNRVMPASLPANSGSINSRLRTVTASSTRQFCRS
jgi:hypothetical protein